MRTTLLMLLACAAAPGSALAQVTDSEEIDALRRQLAGQQAQIEALQRQLEVQRARLQALVQEPPSASPTTSGADVPSTRLAVATPGPDDEHSVKLGGLLQPWYLATTGSSTFRLRRAEVKLSGTVAPTVRWTVMVDPSKSLGLQHDTVSIDGTPAVAATQVNQGSRILQDAYITTSRGALSVDLGQFKIPLSLEGNQPTTGLVTERALFMSDRARGGTYGDVRDVGLMLRGAVTRYTDYYVAYLNGSGDNQNDVDRNDQKALAARMVLRVPGLTGLQVGASGVHGIGTDAERPHRDRLGAELLYVHGPFALQGEFMTGRDGPLEREGGYIHLSYQLSGGLEAILRYDTWDPDTSLESTASSVTETDYVIGLGYRFDDWPGKFQLSLSRKTFDDDVLPDRNQVLLGLMTWW